MRSVILTADKFEDMELFVPYFRLLDAGAHVDIAAPTRDDISGEHEYSITPDILISDVDPAQYDLLIIPGGFPDGAPAVVRSIPHTQFIARAFMTLNKPVAIDGNLVTSRWPADLAAFTSAMMTLVGA
ncbi:MAG: DJ-1/PfpI family protein [Actinomycetota bacterium]|nr:DJ-1/PfpI family protein [Actinomycetota bacterium]